MFMNFSVFVSGCCWRFLRRSLNDTFNCVLEIPNSFGDVDTPGFIVGDVGLRLVFLDADPCDDTLN